MKLPKNYKIEIDEETRSYKLIIPILSNSSTLNHNLINEEFARRTEGYRNLDSLISDAWDHHDHSALIKHKNVFYTILDRKYIIFNDNKICLFAKTYEEVEDYFNFDLKGKELVERLNRGEEV